MTNELSLSYDSLIENMLWHKFKLVLLFLKRICTELLMVGDFGGNCMCNKNISGKITISLFIYVSTMSRETNLFT